MTRTEFLDWPELQPLRPAFDGFQLVALTNRRRGQPCQPYGPDAGVASVGDAAR